RVGASPAAVPTVLTPPRASVSAARPIPSIGMHSASPVARAETDSLHMMSELGWQLEQLEVVQRSGEVLWRRGKASWLELERLIIAAQARGAIDFALAVAEDTWQRHGRPEALLYAMHIAIEHQRWAEAERFESLPGGDRAAVAGRAEYWRMRVARRMHALRGALRGERMDEAQAVLRDLESELIQAGQRSSAFAQMDDYRALWAEWYRQQLYVALVQEDFVTAEAVLRRGQAELEHNPEYWRLRLELHHRRLGEAITEGDYERATEVLAAIRGELGEVRRRGLEHDESIRAVYRDAELQAFYLAVARGDRQAAARLVANGDIPTVDRVRALEWLGRYEQAASLATRARSSAADRTERDELDAPLEAISHRLPRQAGGSARLLVMDGATLAEAGPEVEYTWNRYGVRAAAVGSYLTRVGEDAGEPVREAVLRVAGRRITRSSVTELGIGASLRSADSSPQIDGSHVHRLGRVQLSALGGVHQTTEESARLRQSAVRDHLTGRVSLDVNDRLFVGGQAGVYRYQLRDGTALGDAADVQLSAGYRLTSGRNQLSLRAVGRAFARSCEAEAACTAAQLDGSRLIAGAATLRSGLPGQVATPVSRLRYSLDVTAGWLMPTDRPVLSATAGVGIPIAGRDELAVVAEVSNSMALGDGLISDYARRGISVRYARSLW
ncbi:MAG: tetratricopeptide repeat protein, partial [Myxococcota bacterium]